MVAYLKVKRLKVKSMFDENVIKLRDNKEYIKEAADIVAILCVKQGYDYKDNILAYLKVSLN